MKKLFVIIVLILACEHAQAQQLSELHFLPVTKDRKLTEIKEGRKNLEKSRQVNKPIERDIKSAIDLIDKYHGGEFAAYLMKISDSIEQGKQVSVALQSMEQETKKEIAEREMEILNESADFFLSGLGGVSSLETAGQASGNFSIGARFRLGDYRRKTDTSSWVNAGFVYMNFNTRTSSTDDTNSLLRSFLFPDISKRDFVLGFYWSYSHLRKGWAIEPAIEFSLNRYKTVYKDTTSDSTGSDVNISRSFPSESILIGCKISKVLQFSISKDTSYTAGFFLYPYYNLINVQPKNFADYHDLLGTSDLPATLHAIGLQAGLSVSKLQIFANAKYVLNKDLKLGPSDLKGMTYTLGTIIALDFLKFKLGQ